MTKNPTIKTKTYTILSILIVTPLGFYTKLYTGAGATWINNHLGGTFYVIFWCLIVYFIFPQSKPVIIAGWILVVTILLEFLQLFHPKFLEYFRESFIGKTIIGTSFNWIDFLFYFIGFGIAIMWLNRLNNLKYIKKHKPYV